MNITPLRPSHPQFTLKTHIKRIRDDAVIPTKSHDTDSGFDLTVVDRKGDVDSDEPFKVVMFHTGLQIQPPAGYYYEIVPRSSLQKFGYTLANCVGIIDNQYRGELFVPLYKFDSRAPDLQLPMRVAQLIPRRIENLSFVEVDNLDSTVRGEGGFGSTGKH